MEIVSGKLAIVSTLKFSPNDCGNVYVCGQLDFLLELPNDRQGRKYDCSLQIVVYIYYIAHSPH